MEVVEEQHEAGACQAAGKVFGALDVNWLVHRAAQRFGDAVEAEALRHGIGMRGQLVLSALRQEGGRTQLALGAALALDKTTLTTVLDKLEAGGLVRRLPDPKDRRVRIPEITEAGRQLQETVAEAIRAVTDRLLAVLDVAERKTFEESLRRLVEGCPPQTGQPGGSCM
jgi:MarR family transcriptional regulator, organic hydroperoxide resistance regulator